jgi:N-acetylmuramoyl-L-alanine amidase
MTQEDLEVMAKTIWGESRGESYLGQIGVGYVIKNRVAKPGWWGRDIKSVCLAPYQFSCWNVSDPNREKLLKVSVSDPAYLRALGIAALVLTGDLLDPTQEATSYHASTMDKYPTWTKAMTRTTKLGHHIFYR